MRVCPCMKVVFWSGNRHCLISENDTVCVNKVLALLFCCTAVTTVFFCLFYKYPPPSAQFYFGLEFREKKNFAFKSPISRLIDK